MPGQKIGSVIAAVFGLIYVLVNAGPLPAAWRLTLRVLAAIAFVAVLVAIFRSNRPSRERMAKNGECSVAGIGSWWPPSSLRCTSACACSAVHSMPPRPGWPGVSLVAGVHFFVLAVVFGQRFLQWLGAVITACGVAGLVLAATGAAEATIALIGGVLPGAILLGFGWWGAHRIVSNAEQPESGRQ